MRLTARQLNRTTLDRQMLLTRAHAEIVDAVRALVALQAQEPAAPYVALWNRLAAFDADDLDRAFAERRLVKTPLMRITLHAIASNDYAPFHAAVLPILRSARLNDRRFRKAGLDSEEADALVAALVDFAREVRTKEEILEHLAAAIGREPHERLWWALRTYAPLAHAPTDAPWSFGQRPEYVAAVDDPSIDPTTGVVELVSRYLAAFGPATATDIAQFTMLPMSTIKPALTVLADDLVEHRGPGDEVLVDVATSPPLADADVTAPPRLLGMWDNVLLAYRDRSRIVPDEHRALIIRRNGDVLPSVLVDGRVVGLWRVVGDAVEICAFEPLADDDVDLLDVEARELTPMLAARDPRTFGRYDHWWDKLGREQIHRCELIGRS